jgi:hypothetical protein
MRTPADRQMPNDAQEFVAGKVYTVNFPGAGTYYINGECMLCLSGLCQ